MRLTLRTLLAYLDEILEPKDAEEIGKKLQESEVARTLLHRIRDVMRRLRLKAPDVDEQETALDPNTVAEYLDNTLPDDRVPDFEKVCLESDMHLAEVASCHQVLAMVLGEPAEVDPKSREHMYTLRQVAAEQSEMQAAAEQGYDSDEQSARPARPPRSRPEIPEYLRDKSKKKHRLPLAAVLVAAGCLAAVLLAASGQLEFLGIDSPFAKPEIAADSPAADEPEQDSDQADVAEEKSETADAASAEQTPAVETPEVTAPPLERTSAQTTSAAVPAQIAEQAPAAAQTTPIPTNPSPQISPAQPPAAQIPAQTPTEMPTGVMQPLVPARQTLPEQPPPTQPAVQPPGDQPPVVQEPKTDAAQPGTAAPPERIARFMSDNHVLLRLDAEKHEWLRVPPQDILTPQEDLLSLPTFRPVIAMTVGLTTLRLVDGTRIAFEPSDAQGVPGLKIDYGRVIVQTVGKEQTRLALTLGNRPDGRRKGVLSFGDAACTLTIEVGNELAAGENPETQTPRLKVTFGVVKGRVQWVEEGAEPVEIAASQKLALGDAASDGKPAAMESTPDWIIADSASLLDRSASTALDEELGRDRPVSLGLKELAQHRKKEIRRLAIGSLGHLGNFDPMVDVLNDPEQRLRRPDYIADLREALSRGPLVAAQVREALERQFGPEAAGLYRLLWGFTDEQLEKEKADAMLVDYLDNNLLAYRALAFWNLQAITGLGLYYQPEQPVNKRQQSVRNWRSRQKAGDIRHDLKRRR